MEGFVSEESIEDYVKGNLKGDELILFKNRLSKDPNLQKEVKFRKELIQSIRVLDNRRLKTKILKNDFRDKYLKWVKGLFFILLFIFVLYNLMQKDRHSVVTSPPVFQAAVESKERMNQPEVTKKLIFYSKFLELMPLNEIPDSIFSVILELPKEEIMNIKVKSRYFCTKVKEG